MKLSLKCRIACSTYQTLLISCRFVQLFQFIILELISEKRECAAEVIEEAAHER